MFESPRWYITDGLLAAVAQEKHTAAIRGVGAQTGVGLQPGDSQWFHRAFGAQTGDAARQRRPTNIDVVCGPTQTKRIRRQTSGSSDVLVQTEKSGLPTVCETHLSLNGKGRRLCQSTGQRGCSSGRCNSGSSAIPKKRPRWEMESSDISLEIPAPAARCQVAHGIEMLVSLPRALDVHTSRSCFGWMSGHRPRGLGSPLTHAPRFPVFSKHVLSRME